MSTEDKVLGVVAAKRPRTKFAKYSHSSSFIDPTAQLGEGFHYVNLYDEQIDANLIVSNKNGLILVHNTYLPSFAYNLFLCWLYCHEGAEDGGRQQLDALLTHNFKKFFAEQLYHAHNDIGSRALLLETLLYEQVGMVPVFAAKAEEETLSTRADTAADLMSAVVSFHELGHFFLANQAGIWESVLENEPGTVGILFDRVRSAYPTGFVEEFQCDAMAVISGIRQYADRANLEFTLRVLVFAFAAFAVLFSLARSAQATGEARLAEPVETVDFKSLEKFHREHEIKLGVDQDFVVRANLVAELCQNFARQRGVSLYGQDGSFPLAETIADDLLKYIDCVLNCDDANARAMSNLVAEALHGHDEGMEYLYLRSKTFKTNRKESLRI